MKKLLPVLVSVLLLSSCAPYRPSSDADYKQAESMAINNEHEAVLFNGRGGWHPNTTKIIVGRGAPNEGNLVVTDKAIYFMQWDDIAYHIIFKKDFAEIRSVKPYHYLNKWFVLQTGDTQFDMFAFPFDSDKTEQVCTYLKQRIQQNKAGQ